MSRNYGQLSWRQRAQLLTLSIRLVSVEKIRHNGTGKYKEKMIDQRMRLGFHYHIPADVAGGEIRMPGHLARFAAGSAAGLMVSPTAERLTPGVKWEEEAERAMAEMMRVPS